MIRRRGVTLAVLFVTLGLAVYLLALAVDLPWLSRLNTYGNFDRPGQPGFVNALLPGLADSAGAKVYRFGHGIHVVPIVALLVVFAVFLWLRSWRSVDVKMGLKSWLTAP